MSVSTRKRIKLEEEGKEKNRNTCTFTYSAQLHFASYPVRVSAPKSLRYRYRKLHKDKYVVLEVKR